MYWESSPGASPPRPGHFGHLTVKGSAGAVNLPEDGADTNLAGTSTASGRTLTSNGALTDATGASLTVTGNGTLTATSINLADNLTDVGTGTGTAVRGLGPRRWGAGRVWGHTRTHAAQPVPLPTSTNRGLRLKRT